MKRRISNYSAIMHVKISGKRKKMGLRLHKDTGSEEAVKMLSVLNWQTFNPGQPFVE